MRIVALLTLAATVGCTMSGGAPVSEVSSVRRAQVQKPVPAVVNAAYSAQEPEKPARPPVERGAPGSRADGLAAAIEAVRARPEFRGSTFGILFVHAKTGRIVYEHGADRLLAPASTTKLVSSSGALLVLGKDFRCETTVVATGELRGGTLHGDLVLIAGGDPNLSQRAKREGRLAYEDFDHSYAGFGRARLVEGDPLLVLKKLARQVAKSGVRRVQGKLIVDDGLFRERRDSFVGPLSALCVNDNLVDVMVRPGDKVGDPVRVDVLPKASFVKVGVLAKTGVAGSRPDLWLETREGLASFDLRGSVAVDASPVLRVATVREPAQVGGRYFVEVLRDAGVEIRDKIEQAQLGPTIYEKYAKIAKHSSAPLAEMIRVVLKVSQNVHATMLPLLVAAAKGKRGDRRTGYALMRRAFLQGGLNTEGVILHSASGGARADSVSARWLVKLLRFMSAREDFPVFLDALPVGGVDGTLAEHFHGSKVQGKVRAKTGTLVYHGSLNNHWIYLAKSLAGYVDLRTKDRPDDLWAFCILIANTAVPHRLRGAQALFRAQEDVVRAVMEHVSHSNQE